MNKFTFAVFAILLTCGKIFSASENTVVVAGYEFDSPRTSIIASQMEIHFYNTIDRFTSLNYVNPDDFRSLASRKGLTMKKDIITLASRLDISAIIFIKLTDRVSQIEFTIEAWGTDIPYNNGRIYSFKKTVNMSSQNPDTAYNLISEDMTIQFLARFLNIYVFPVFSENSSGKQLYEFETIDGYKTYRLADKAGKGKLFYFQDYTKESALLEKALYSKKKKITTIPPKIETTLTLSLLTPVFSMVSPLTVPYNYFHDGRYSETALWFLSSSPYYYLACSGFLNNPQQLRDDKHNISRIRNANYVFAWYQLFGGGAAFFMDSAASRGLYRSGNYISTENYIANDDYAVFLSLVCGGAGHFYKGSRKWGYFFYHADTILLYSTLYFASSKETYSSESDTYTSSGPDIDKAVISGVALAALKSFEIFHLMRTRNDITLGEDATGLLSLDISIDESGQVKFMAGKKF